MPGRLRVLQVTPRFFPDMGGIETHVYETARRLNTMPGLRVDILTTDRDGSRPPVEVVEGIRVRRVPAWPRERDYYVAPRIRAAVGGGYYDLVHCQGAHTAVPVIAMTAALAARTPYLVSPHTGGHSSAARHRLRGAQWRALGPLLRRARQVVCVAEFEKEMFARLARVATDRLRVIPNGVEPASTTGIRPAAGTPTVVSVGRFEKYKGQHHLIAALPALLEQEPRAQLVLVGRGPYEDELRAQAARLGVADRVGFTFVPPAERQSMTDLLAGAHVVALLSEYEAHPVAVMEAIALGRPVVVAPGTGLGELADRGLAERVDDPADPHTVAAALLRHLSAQTAAGTRTATGGGTGGTGDAPVGEGGHGTPSTRLPTWDDCANALADSYRAHA
ncbi:MULTISPECIES: glycosyltransferase family 4 protein [unclassified Frankia]|uniref:glycosyltransferase family 4 protein n=1 Tax=unclassified Frankia TaxID=2632575 RepID=UPI00202511FE